MFFKTPPSRQKTSSLKYNGNISWLTNHTEVEFREKSSSTARSVIELCLKKAGYEPYLRTGFFLDLFLYHEHQVANTAQSVININSIKPGLPVFM
jgi:hypothetical protein